MSMDFELKLDGKTMSRFLLHYNYTKATGLFGILLGIASLAAVFIKWNMWNANQRVVWIVIAVLFLIVQPLTLAKKGRRQMAQEEMQIPLFCHIDEEGISVTQGEASSSCKWSDLRKVVYRKNEMYLFTSAIYATIITRNSCEEKFGKTVFAKGFAHGLGITEPVTSPTFTIVQEYHEGRLPLYHFDVYRIADAEEMYELDCEGYFYGDGVCLIEWASQIRDILPDDCHQVTIAKDLEKGFDFRQITLDEMR